MATQNPELCAHCGKTLNGRGGISRVNRKTGKMDMVYLCHPPRKRDRSPIADPQDCYHLVTVWGHELGLPTRSSELAALIQSGEWRDILDHLHERISDYDARGDERPRAASVDEDASTEAE